MLKLCLLFLLVAARHCTGASRKIEAEEETDKEFEAALRYSAWDMYKTINGAETYKNFVFSPMSIQHAIGMLLAGSLGKTRKQMLDFLRMSHGKYQIYEQFRLNTKNYFIGRENLLYPTKLANRIYMARGFRPDPWYTSTIKTNFGADVEYFDARNPTGAANSINNWVNEVTEGMIPRIAEASHIRPLTKMVLMNALYFKASWKESFSAMKEKLEWTHVEDGRRTKKLLDGMETNSEFYYIDDGYRSGMIYLAIPYDLDGMEVYFVIALPQRPYQRALKDFDKYLLGDMLTEKLPYIKRYEFYERPAGAIWNRNRPGDKVQMPEFEIASEVPAKEVLQKLGVTDLFDEGRSNLNRMSKEKGLSVSTFKHKAVIKVNKFGTEAAAATMAVISGRIGGSNTFVVNQHFFFGVYYWNNFLFMGNCYDPTVKE